MDSMPRWIEPGSYPKPKQKEKDPKRQLATKRAWITKYLKAGRSPVYVKKLLGINQNEMTRAYGRMKKDGLHKAPTKTVSDD